MLGGCKPLALNGLLLPRCPAPRRCLLQSVRPALCDSTAAAHADTTPLPTVGRAHLGNKPAQLRVPNSLTLLDKQDVS